MLSIKNNLMAENAARHLGKSYDTLSTSVQRLSSGLRINGAKDDAAGLAVRELIRADVAALRQGSRNAADAVSMSQTAEGGLAVMDDLLVRMRELAEQASTDSYSAAQRTIMNEEFQQLAAEITRIANNTAFNNNNLLTADTDNAFTISLGQGTASATQVIRINSRDMTATGLGLVGAGLGGTTGTDQYRETSFTATNSLTMTSAATGNYMVNNSTADSVLTLNVMGSDVDITLGHNSAQQHQGQVADAVATAGTAYIGATGDSILTMTWDGVTRTIGSDNDGTADVTTTGLDDGGTMTVTELATAINTAFNGQTGTVGGVMGDIASAVDLGGGNFVLQIEANANVDYGEVDDFAIAATTGAVAYEATATAVATATFDETVTGDDGGSYTLNGIVAAINAQSNGVAATDGSANDLGDIASVGSNAAGTSNWLVLTSNAEYLADADITDITVAITGGALAWADGDAIATADLTKTQVGDVATDADAAQIDTQTNAEEAIALLDAAISEKDTFRAHLGYMMNRLESAASVVDIQAENLLTAESRISDVDVATEMAAMTRTQVLAQAGVSMLAQANSMPQMALKLLG
jgi:flagellin